MPYTTKKYCVGAVGSMTAALKATQALGRHGILAEVIGLSANETKRGCAYGVCFDCNVINEVRNLLKGNGVSVSQYLTRGGTP